MTETPEAPRLAETFAEAEDALLSRWPETRLEPSLDRIRALTELGHQVDLVTYPFGRDVSMPGLRVFRVACNGQTLIDKLDLGETPGPRRALSRTFTTRAAGGKGLDVRFDALVAKPVVSGLRVRRVR